MRSPRLIFANDRTVTVMEGMIVKSGLQIYDAKPQWQEPECRYNSHSNVPFAIVGIWGLVFLVGMRGGKFSDPRERWLYEGMFAGLILTAVGSAYYRLAPDNDRLVWGPIA